VPGQEACEDKVPDDLRDAHTASVYEQSSTARKLMRDLARRLAAQGGVLIAIDYGYHDRAAGDTLQACTRMPMPILSPARAAATLPLMSISPR